MGLRSVELNCMWEGRCFGVHRVECAYTESVLWARIGLHRGRIYDVVAGHTLFVLLLMMLSKKEVMNKTI